MEFKIFQTTCEVSDSTDKAVLIHGTQACGKTTLGRLIAERFGDFDYLLGDSLLDEMYSEQLFGISKDAKAVIIESCPQHFPFHQFNQLILTGIAVDSKLGDTVVIKPKFIFITLYKPQKLSKKTLSLFEIIDLNNNHVFKNSNK